MKQLTTIITLSPDGDGVYSADSVRQATVADQLSDSKARYTAQSSQQNETDRRDAVVALTQRLGIF